MTMPLVNRDTRCLTLAVSAVLLLGAPAFAQTDYWIGAGPGDWSDGTKWSLGSPPGSYDNAQINDGSTVTVDVDPPNLSSLYLGIGGSDSGGLILGGATSNLLGTQFYLGYGGSGNVQINPGGNLRFTSGMLGGYTAASSGTISVDGGELRFTVMYAGNAGNGEVVLNDGILRVTSFTLAYQPGSVGTLTQYGGTFTATTFHVSNDGDGMLSLQGGTTTFNSGGIGYTTTGPPGLMLIGGTADVTATSITVGVNGAGIITQTGGILDLGHLNLTHYSVTTGEGTYNLDGGTLDVNVVRPGAGVNKQFVMTAGTLVCNTFGQSGDSLPLAPTGGLIRPRGDYTGHMDVFGDFILGLGAALEMELNLPYASDGLDVIGTVTLAGSLAPVLITPPGLGDTYVVIDNDGSDPVVGTFAGLPEGAVVTLSVGPDDYEYVISYVGGDGNDVVLQVDCPTDFNGDGVLDSADIAAFITLYLAGDLAADLSGDGYLDGGDLSIFTTAYLVGC